MFTPFLLFIHQRARRQKSPKKVYSDCSESFKMEQNVPCFSLHLVNLNKLPMYQDFLGPRGLQGTHMDTKEKSKSITFTVRGGFFTLLAILAYCAPLQQQQPAGSCAQKTFFPSFQGLLSRSESKPIWGTCSECQQGRKYNIQKGLLTYLLFWYSEMTRSVSKRRNATIYNIIHWFAGPMGRWDKQLVDQVSDVPSIFFSQFLIDL